MKKTLTLVALSFLAFTSFGQLTFEVSPGLNFNSASVGYQFGKIQPYLGFQHLGAGLRWEENGQQYDGSGNLVDYTNTVDYKVHLYLPTVGVKYYAIEKESIKGYFNVNFTKVVATGKFLIDGEEDEYVADIFDESSAWGAEIGYGMEYFFDDHFSVGGEFGLRLLSGKNTSSYETNIFNPNTGTSTASEVTNTVRGTLSPTYTKIGLKFYF